MGRDPRPLLDAVAALAGEPLPAFQVEFVGRTDHPPGSDLLADARKRGVEDLVVCRPQVSYEQSLADMTSADLLLLLESPSRNLGVPAKLYEYIGAGRPILALSGGSPDLETILRDSGAPYRLVPCQDVPAIRAALAELIRGVRAGSLPPASEEARKQFTREALSRRLAEMLDGLIAKGAP
jgi:glycosyltransferase involved in cell wall biosynthesis